MLGGGILAADKTIKLRPDTSVLGIRSETRSSSARPSFTRLADAFFLEIELKYP
jgi:hypothetical protein